ncbi:hypothetical protein RND81_11G115800 [Saponaria officinalis]|uniref:Uncharacterized protein n=1 Tax=Saponaria officinalis TaxID=3572 RepID=A0AAW1HKN2_SAPOF
MVFLKIRKFRKAQKPKSKMDLEEKLISHSEELNNKNNNVNGKTVLSEATADVHDDDDDDLITNEADKESEMSSGEGRETEFQVEHLYCDFESIYEKYYERMLFFDRISPWSPSTSSPKAASRKFASSFRRLSLKKNEDPDSETEQLQPPDYSPYQDLETAYVAQLCLTWEALHSQCTQLRQKISCQPESRTCYNHCAQQYQQFQVLIQRFIENEPFEQGFSVVKYARSRNTFSKLLRVPNVGGGICNLFENQNQTATSLQKIQSLVEKKMLKLKELSKKKGLKKKSWPRTDDKVDLLLSLIDTKVVLQVLRMVRITKDQLLWCSDKMKKLGFIKGRLRRNLSPILFPC